MASRKEDEKNEATIRRLLKQPENKRCINCNSLGPQYVCTTFSTFVCTPCSGVHREFSHRIKSVSMAKFTASEVSNLQAGGNERAKLVFFRDMDPVRNPLPDSGNPDKLRDFIKRVYVDRRYSGDKPPKTQQDESALELRRPDPQVDRTLDAGSFSIEDRVADKRSYLGRKSDVQRNSMEKKGSPRKFEPTGRPTRHSYDESDGRIEEKSPKYSSQERRSLSRPFSFRDFDITPPPAQSITDILGDVPGLRLEIYKSPNGSPADSRSRSRESSNDTRKTLQSQSFSAVGSERVTPAAQVHKRINSASLIDLNGQADPADTSGGVVDPFAETSQGSPATSSSWATFNSSPTPPAPAGYPASKSDTSQWPDAGWSHGVSATEPWSGFGVPSSVHSQGMHSQEHNNIVLPTGSQSSPGSEPATRQRREIPHDFFVPSFEDAILPSLDMRRRQQMQPVFRPPQLDASVGPYQPGGFPGTPQNPQAQPLQIQPQSQPSPQTFPQPIQPQHQLQTSTQMPPAPPTPRSRNPFDDDEDDVAPARVVNASSTQFPSMGTLQAALPSTLPVSTGVSSVEMSQATAPQTLPSNDGAPDWSNSFAEPIQHTVPAGGFSWINDQTTTPFQMPSYSMQPDAPGLFLSPHPFAQEVPYRDNQFFTQNVVRPAGGNPFG